MLGLYKLHLKYFINFLNKLLGIIDFKIAANNFYPYTKILDNLFLKE